MTTIYLTLNNIIHVILSSVILNLAKRSEESRLFIKSTNICQYIKLSYHSFQQPVKEILRSVQNVQNDINSQTLNILPVQITSLHPVRKL